MPESDLQMSGLDRPLIVLFTRKDNLPDPEVFRAIMDQAQVFGWDLFDLRFTYGELPAHREVAGAIIDALPPDKIACSLREKGIPAVRVGKMAHPQDNLLPAVLPNLAAGAQMVVDHFSSVGLRDLAFVGRQPWATGMPFFNVFKECCDRSGHVCHLVQVPSGPESLAARHRMRSRAIKEWLLDLPRPIGIFTSIDRDAAFVCNVCDELGVRVPQEVALVGSGNRELDCELAGVPLSSLDWAKREQGLQAAALLKQLIDGAEQPAAPLLVEPAGVVVRRSSVLI